MSDLAGQQEAFIEVLEDLPGLTELAIRDLVVLDDASTRSRIFSRTNLQSLEIKNGLENEVLPEPYTFSHLQQLTKLVTEGFTFGDSLSMLTNLVHLSSRYTQEPALTLIESLVYTPKLEWLHLENRNYADISGEAFTGLTNLSYLKMHMQGGINETFIPSLALLPKLTELKLGCRLGVGTDAIPDSVSQLSCLSNLRNLKILFYRKWNVLEYFPRGSFPRLRRLKLPLSGVSKDDIEELVSRLPSALKVSR